MTILQVLGAAFILAAVYELFPNVGGPLLVLIVIVMGTIAYQGHLLDQVPGPQPYQPQLQGAVTLSGMPTIGGA